MQLNAALPIARRLPLPGASRRLAIGAIFAILVLAVGAVVASQTIFKPAAATPGGQLVTARRATVASTVNATGSTVASKQAKLAFSATGKLKEIPVGVGDQVKAGQVLGTLSADALEVKLDQAKSQLAVAQLKLQQLTEGATAEEVAAAQAAYDAAMAKLSDVQAGPVATDVAAAQASIASAQAGYDQALAKLQTLESGATDADTAAAQASVESARNSLTAAEAKLEQLKAGPTPEDLQTAQSSVEQARASLRSAEAKLEQVRASAALANPDLVAAQAQLDTARAKLDQLKATSAFSTDVIAAQSSLTKAEADVDAARRAIADLPNLLQQALADLEDKTHAVDVAKKNAQETCDKNGSGSAACQTAQNRIDSSYTAFYAAEAKYDRLNGDNAPDVRAANQALATAQANYESAKAKLQQTQAAAKVPADLIAAQASYDSARAKFDQVRATAAVPADVAAAQSSVDQARASLASAEAKFRTIQQGPTNADVVAAETSMETARANLASAEAKLAALGVSTPQDLQSARSAVASAKAGLDSARAKLDQVQAGPTNADVMAAQSSVAQAQSGLAAKAGNVKASDIALQQEAVRQAELSVKQAQLDLDNAILVAPFDGVVAAIAGNVGEQAPTGTTGYVTLLDPSQTRVDVTVDETDVAKVQIGKQAQVTFDALPGQPYTGKVIAVSPTGTQTQGVVSYLVSLSIEPVRVGRGGAGQAAPAAQGRAAGRQDAGSSQSQAQPTEQTPPILPAGLTASATITIDQRENALIVPSRAIRRQGRDQVVEVVTGEGKNETRVVRTGIVSDQNTEILEGLEEGQQVFIPSTTTRQPNVGGPGGFSGGGGGQVFVQSGPAPAAKPTGR